MWRPNEPVEEGVSDFPDIDRQSKRRRSRRRAWRDGLADETVVGTLEHVRSYRAFERTLIGSVDPRSAVELALVHRLASLLWRLRRASAIETGLFEMQAEFLFARRQTPSRRPGQPATLQTAAQGNGHKTASGPTGATIRRLATKNRCQCPCAGHWLHGRGPAPSPNISCVSPILTLPCLTAWGITKRGCGAKRRKRFGPSRRCDDRLRPSRGGHFASRWCSLLGCRALGD